MGLTYGSVCSGIEAATQAWHPLGWRPSFFAEIDERPREVLSHHYPDVPLRGDFTKIESGDHDPIDLLVGGTPCQSFSIAGLRKGMDDDRGNLALEYCRLADRLRPQRLVWENVPGVLSSNEGRDFGALVGALGKLGYSLAYRVLDAQFIRTCRFGRAIPQRRRRVILVGHLGDWRAAAAVLSDAESLSGHPAPRREARQGFAGGFECGPSGGRLTDCAPTLDTRCKDGPIRNQLGAGVVTARKVAHGEYIDDGVASAMKARDFKGGTDLIAFNSRQDPEVTGARAGPLDSQSPQAQAVAYDLRGREGGSQFEGPHDTANIRAADGGSSRSYVQAGWAVRRLTPVEAERLQAMRDNFTAVPTPRTRTVKADMAKYMKRHDLDVWQDNRGRWRTNIMADGPRYKMLGNSMAVNVMEFVGERIKAMDAVMRPHPKRITQ